jgi:hypothetical protein
MNNCGSLYIPIGSKHIDNGLSIKVYYDDEILLLQTVHSVDALLTCEQTFLTTSSIINLSQTIIPNKFTIYSPGGLQVNGTVIFVIKIKDTDEVLAFEVISDRISVDGEIEINNLVSNTNNKSVSLFNQKLQLEIHSICDPAPYCCDKLPSSVTLINQEVDIICTTTTTTLPPFCSSFNLPDNFYATVVGYGDLDGQQKRSLFVRSGNIWSTSGTFPCGANFVLSMACNDSNRNFSYDGSISCCNPDTKIIIDETIQPLIYPEAILGQIVWYSDCSDCVSCTTTTTSTSTTSPPPVDCREGQSLSINGYAFYTDRRSIRNIPGVGDLVSPCFGGHVCNRTDFMPEIVTPSSIISASNPISLNNLPGGGDRSDTFSFSIPDASVLKDGASLRFKCLSPNNNCHQNTTWVVLTTNIDNTTSILFNSCVLPNDLDDLNIKCEDCCDWDGNTTLTWNCGGGNILTFPLIFSEIHDNLWECNQTLSCGDTLNALVSCDPQYKLPKPPSTQDCLQKWSVLNFDVSCSNDASIVPGSLLQNCECNSIPEFTWVASDLDNCQCCPKCYQCFYFNFSLWNAELFSWATPGEQYFTRNITIPISIPIPCRIHAIGGSDDAFMKDGEFLTDVIDFGTISTNSKNQPESDSITAHTFDYQWIQSSRSFTLSARDNYGGNAGWNALICAYPLAGATQECGPTIVLSGSLPLL